jgi:hypothetical protein
MTGDSQKIYSMMNGQKLKISISKSNDTTPLLLESEQSPHTNNLLGGLLALISSLLSTISRTILQQFNLDFSDVLIVRYFLQVVIFSIVIKYDDIRVRDVSSEKAEPSRKVNHNRKVISLLPSTLTMSSWVGMLTVAMMGIGAHFMLYQAIALSNPVLVSFIRVFDIVIAYSIQSTFLRQAITNMGIVGSSLVVAAIILLGLEHSFVKLLPVGLNQIF